MQAASFSVLDVEDRVHLLLDLLEPVVLMVPIEKPIANTQAEDGDEPFYAFLSRKTKTALATLSSTAPMLSSKLLALRYHSLGASVKP